MTGREPVMTDFGTFRTPSRKARVEEMQQRVTNRILYIGAPALLVVGIVVAILDRGAPSIIAVRGTGFLLVVLLLLAKFKRFKGFGFEAEMWEEKQEEAAVLVDELKKN
jgi:preprotein translocase subunit SecY